MIEPDFSEHFSTVSPFLCIQHLFLRISPCHTGEIPDVFDVGKVFSENLLLCQKIFSSPTKDTKDCDPLVTKLPDLCRRILDGIISKYGVRFCCRTVDNDIVGTVIT